MTVHADTRVFTLLGDPVSHSLSPALQNAAFAAAAVNAVYVALRCAAGTAPGLLRAIALAGGGGNITIPHKTSVIHALDSRTGAVDATGACNTFWLEDGRVCGDNTDVEAFAAAARTLVQSLDHTRVLLMGAGGAARAVLHALLQHGAASIDVVNRTSARARELATFFDPHGRCIRVRDRHDVAGHTYDLMVNATAVGMADGATHVVDPAVLAGCGAVLDLVYRHGGTALVHRARERGIPAADGLDMLVAQGALAFTRWFGRAAPVDAMRAAVNP